MKFKITTLATLFLPILFLSFTNTEGISNCFISFKKTSDLKADKPDRLPETSEKFRFLTTNDGEVKVSRIDGYRILYNNKKKAPFVNLKVELSESKSYENDKIKLIESLKYINSKTPGMETKDLIELEFNGYHIYGTSRGTIKNGTTLGVFIMFPGNDVTVHFYFNNLKPEVRNFESIEDYKVQRNNFMDAYTKHITKCMDKKN